MMYYFHTIIGSRKLKTYNGGMTSSGITFKPTFIIWLKSCWDVVTP